MQRPPEPLPGDLASPSSIPSAAHAARPGRETPDPGSPRARAVTWLLVLVLFSVTVFLQQCEQRPATPVTPAQVDPDSDMTAMMTRMLIKVGRTLNGMDPGAGQQVLAQLDTSVQQSPNPRTDRLRAAIAAAEVANPEEAMQRLDDLERDIQTPLAPQPAPSLTPPSSQGNDAEPANDAPDDPDAAPDDPEPTADTEADLLRDVGLLRAVYAGHAADLTQDERDHLITRHGKLGRIALTFGRPDSDPERAALIGGGGTLIATLVAFGALLVLVVPASIICFALMLARIAARRVRPAFVPPERGGSIYLETLAVFLLAFLLVKIVVTLIASLLGPDTDPSVPTLIALCAQWPVALAAFWPVCRGMPLAEHARRIGLHQGKGALREIGAGVFGYLAGLPVVAVAFVLTIVAVLLRTMLLEQAGEPAEPPSNPVFEIVTLGGAIPVMLFLLATIWAPFTEEAIFRGSLFRHLRAGLGLLGAAVVSALMFGFMHGYAVYMLLPVITLGFNFALMREWRGSLIAPITAHALHNGTVMGFVLVILSQLN